MNALRHAQNEPMRRPERHGTPSSPRQSPRPFRRSTAQRKPAPSQRTRTLQHHRTMAVESLMKVGVNLGVSIVALTTLVHLLPYRSAQTQKLQEVQGEVQKTEIRVGLLQSDFGRSFDSSQVKSILQEQTHMVDPTQKAIIFDERATDAKTDANAQSNEADTSGRLR